MYFPVLEEVKSSAAFVNNTFITVEFPELTDVGESLAFVSCSRLTTIKANSLEEVGGTFQLANNTKLAVIDGFQKLAVVGGAVDLSGVFTNVTMDSLDDVRGGFNLQSTEDVSCSEFTDLKSSGVIKGDDFTCAGKKETAESKTSGLGTAGNGGGDDKKSSAATFGVSVFVATLVGVAAMVAL